MVPTIGLSILHLLPNNLVFQLRTNYPGKYFKRIFYTEENTTAITK